jgi:chemotaxis protein methyltransferase CheR
MSNCPDLHCFNGRLGAPAAHHTRCAARSQALRYRSEARRRNQWRPMDVVSEGQPRSTLRSRDDEYSCSPTEFTRACRLIYRLAGISIAESKQGMVSSRLARRVRALGLSSLGSYLDLIERNGARHAETQEFINALTTNLTAFYREPHHFETLTRHLIERRGGAAPRLWCAAASTGEEAYSIAMTVDEACGADSGARLLATDIDTRALADARRGVYRLDAARRCGEARLKRHFLRGCGAQQGLVRIRPALAQRIEFAPLNLLDPSWPVVQSFASRLDAVFCRNVLIYFDKSTQARVIDRLARVLRPGGLLFVGHAENLTEHREQFTLRGKSVYERR